MREERSIIGAKGLITLPKEWRESHNITEDETIQAVYRLGGVLVVTPTNRSLSPLEDACITFLEKGPSVEDLKDFVAVLTEAKLTFSDALKSLEASSNAS